MTGSTGRHLWWPFLTVSGRPEKGRRRTRLIVLRITWLLPFFSPGKVFLVVGRFLLIVGSFSMLWEQQRLNKIKGIKPEEVGWKEASSTSWSDTWTLNLSKATAGKCIRDTGTCVITGDAVGHLATIWSGNIYLKVPTHGWALVLSQHSAHWTL